MDDTLRAGNIDTMLSPEIGANRAGQTWPPFERGEPLGLAEAAR